MLPIYCDHFGLTREPFSITPDPSFLYLSESHKEALAQLVYGINARRGFVVLTGEVGTGKTTLIQCLLQELNGTTKTAFIFNVIVNPADLLRYVCERFGLVSSLEGYKDIHDYIYLLEKFLHESYRDGSNVALIIDEAQNLSTEVLENVRLLSNFETAKAKLLQILLVGQPELGTRLNASELRQVKQRVALRHHLDPLNQTESKDYVARRLEIAGGSLSLFTGEAVAAVHNFSGGIPRIINILCDNGLLTAYALRKPRVEAGMIEEIARDFQLAASGLSREVVGKGPSERLALQLPERNFQRPIRPQSQTLPPLRSLQHFGDPGSVKKPAVVLEPRSVVTAVTSPPNSPKQADRSSEAMSDIVPAGFFASMTRALTDAMGPMASFVVTDQVRAMGESVHAFPKHRLAQLVEETSREILHEPLKAGFQRAMFNEIGSLNSGRKQ